MDLVSPIAVNNELGVEINMQPKETAVVTGAMRKVGVIIKSCSTSTKLPVKGNRRHFACYKCNKKFTKRHVFIEHWLKHMEQILEKLGTSARRIFRKFKCKRCKDKFVNMSQLGLHLEVCSVSDCDTFFKCYVCQKQFTSEKELKEHKASHVKQYACTFCDKRWNRKSDLETHLRVHSNLRPFKCSLCDASFKRKDKVKEHMATHSSDRPHACSQCQATFKQRQTLYSHYLWAHSDLRPYPCQQCDCRYKRQSNLQKHVLSIHSSEKPHQCKLCKVSFKLKGNLTSHMVLHLDDADKPYKCHLCNYTACRRFSFKEHQRLKHGLVHFSSR